MYTRIPSTILYNKSHVSIIKPIVILSSPLSSLSYTNASIGSNNKPLTTLLHRLHIQYYHSSTNLYNSNKESNTTSSSTASTKTTIYNNTTNSNSNSTRAPSYIRTPSNTQSNTIGEKFIKPVSENTWDVSTL